MNEATEPRPGFRLPLATAVFLLCAVLLGLGLGAAIWFTWDRGARIAERAVQEQLAVSAAVQQELTARRLEEVEFKVQLIAADPSFVKYVSDAWGGGLGLGGDLGLDSASINDLLRERQESVGFDLGLITDPDGRVLARTDQAEAFEASLAEDPFMASAIGEARPISGFWREGGALYQAAAWPLDLDGDLVGFMLVALRVDDALSGRVGRASGADVAFLLPEGDALRLIGTSLEGERRLALEAALSADPALAAALRGGGAQASLPLRLGAEAWTAAVAPVDPAGGAQLGATLRLASADRASAGYRELLDLLLLAAGGVLVIAVPFSYLLARTTLRPLSTMARAATAAANGDYRTRIGIRGRDALAELSQAFDTLLSDLREKSDIQGYVSNLSRFLPDPAADAPTGRSFVTQPDANPGAPGEAPRRGPALLLALDLRGLARLPEGGPEAPLASAAERARDLLSAATAQSGRLVAHAGARLTFAFDSADRLARALAVAREALRDDPATAGALLEGDVVAGTLKVGRDSQRVLLGAPAHQLDRLVVEAGAGRVLLPKSLGEAARGLLGGITVPVQQGAASGKPFYALDAASLAPLAAPARVVDDGEGMRTVEQPVAATPAPRTARSAELAAGTRLGGRYDILGVLGAGGMGVVYKARDIELDDVVALKMLKPGALSDPEQIERLKSEIRLARKITHPNVLRTFDFGEVEGRPYISMEYVRGMTLRYLIKQAGRIPYSAALRIARQLCAGLAAAHEVGVLHRDIKPENLILESSGNAKLMDFGIARPIQQRADSGLTQPGMFVGTPAYSAPEQIAGMAVDERADVYASGVLMCEMFCGKVPFESSNTMEIYLARMQQEPIRPSQWWAEIPPPLEAVILRCIQREPSARFQSATELGTALSGLRA
ncbi:MAG: protein kinase [Xanthomonadaceae bacterium]|jgi:serine/threonine-protein kinase|nr:protein kinase [Xanthomonadaceae bacterium]